MTVQLVREGSLCSQKEGSLSVGFAFNKPVQGLPSKITHHIIDNKHLVIAPDLPSWIVLNEVGFDIFSMMQSPLTLYEIFQTILSKHKLSEDQSFQEIKKVLEAIVDQDFFQEADILHKKHYMIVELYLTNKCNLTCVHCYMDAGKPLENELTSKDWLKVIDEVANIDPVGHIVFLGGEPLLHQDARELITYAGAKGLITCLKTNGTQFHSFEDIQQVMENIDYIDISLDGATAEVHDAIRGHKGSFQKVMQTVEYLKQLNREFTLVATLMKQNAEDFVENSSQLYKNLDTNLVQFRIGGAYREIGRGENFTGILPLSEFNTYRKNTYANLSTAGYSYYERKTNVKRDNCAFGTAIVISSNGSVSPCHAFSHLYGNIKHKSLQSIVNEMHDLYSSTLVDNIEECKTCDLKYICGGGCKVNNFIKHNSYTQFTCPDSFKMGYYLQLAGCF